MGLCSPSQVGARAPLTGKHGPQPHQTGRPGENTRKLCTPADLERRSGWAELTVLRAKPTALTGQGTGGTCQCETTDIALVIFKLLLLLCLGRETDLQLHLLLQTAISLCPDQGAFPEHVGSRTTHPTALLTVAAEQSTARGLTCLQSETGRQHLPRIFLPDSGPQTMSVQAVYPILLPHLILSTASSPNWDWTHQSTESTTESILQPHLSGWGTKPAVLPSCLSQ